MMLCGQPLYYSSLAVVSILAPAVSWLGEREVSMKRSRRGKVERYMGRIPRISAAILKERQNSMTKLQKLCSKYGRAPVRNIFKAKFSGPSSELALCSSVCFDCAKEKLQGMQIMAF